MLYAENALEELRDCISKHSFEFELGDITQKKVNVIAKKNGVAVTTWFDVECQLFGFNILSGGCKTYEGIADFEEYFVTYMQIYTDFIPTAKMIANKFEEDLGVQSIYDNFMGNKSSGYTAIFRILGKGNNKVRIQDKGDGLYSVCITESKDGTSKHRVLSEYSYLIEDGVANLVYTVDLYDEEISNKCKNFDDIEVTRIGENSFSFSIHNLTVVVDILIKNGIINYCVKQIDKFDFDLLDSFTPQDPFDIEELYQYCMDMVSSVTKESPDNTEEDVSEKAEDTQDSEDVSEEDMADCDCDCNVEQVEADAQEQETLSEVNENMSLSVKVVKDNDLIVSVHFITDNAIFSMSADKASSLGIPIGRISDTVCYVDGSVIPMTADEKERHMFSQDISDNDAVCHQLYSDLFN